ncbi:helix-turn-helix domain-containing protein [Flindersiella endophytica]
MSDETIGELLRRLRKERGWVQREVAERLNDLAEPSDALLVKENIGRYERGDRVPRRRILYRLATVFHIDYAELERAAYGRKDPEELLSAPDAIQIAFEWLVTDPPQLEHLRAGRRIGEGTTARAEQRVQELRLLDDHLGGADTLTLVQKELCSVEALVNEGSYTELVGRRLLSVLGELGQLAGWTASDADDHSGARRYYLDGVRAAHAGHDPIGAANLLSSLAYQEASLGNASDAILLAQAALKGAGPDAKGRVRALLLERLAWSYAKAGQNKLADQTLDRVGEAFAENVETEPSWVYWLDQHEIDVMAGRCYVELRRPLRAVPLLGQAISHYDHSRSRETALYETWLAESYVQANELDAAKGVLESATQRASDVNSPRLTSRVQYVQNRLAQQLRRRTGPALDADR